MRQIQELREFCFVGDLSDQVRHQEIQERRDLLPLMLGKIAVKILLDEIEEIKRMVFYKKQFF